MTSPRHTRRPIWLGALIAPLAAPGAFLLYAFASVFSREGLAGLRDWPAAILFYMFGVPIAYGAMIALGLPYLMWLQRNDRLGWLSVCVGAAVAGAVSYPVGIALLGASSQPTSVNLLTGSMLGAVCGALFCVITRPCASGAMPSDSHEARQRVVTDVRTSSDKVDTST